jgi:hypothetical protein
MPLVPPRRITTHKRNKVRSTSRRQGNLGTGMRAGAILDGRSLDEFSIAFGRIEMTYWTMGGEKIVAYWDLRTNRGG